MNFLRLDVYFAIHAVGDEALLVRNVMHLFERGVVGLRAAERDAWPQSDLRDRQSVLGVLGQHAHSVILVGIHNQFLFRRDHQEREHVQLDSDATSISSGSTQAGLPKYVGVADISTDVPFLNFTM
jgi:hypothetical protein